MRQFEEALISTRDILINYPKQHKDNLDYLDRLHKEEIDILHVMEFVDLGTVDGFFLYKEVQKVRRERRKIKDENEMLEPILELSRVRKINENEINSTLGRIRQISKNQEKRGCRMRIREDLQELVDTRRSKVYISNN